MRKGKYAKNGIAAKTVALLLALVLVIGGTVGGTLAWLLDKSDPVVNTFNVGDVEVGLKETDTDPDQEGDQHDYKMIPGWTITKDPVTWVTADSEDCYLFIQVSEEKGVVTYKDAADGKEKTTTWSDFLTYEIAKNPDGTEAWTKLSGGGPGTGTSVYYRIFEADDTANKNVKGTEYPILKDNQVKVKETVTKEMMDAVAAAPANRPTLSFKAYAVQLDKSNNAEFTAQDAWDLVKD